MPKIKSDVIGRGLNLKDNGVDNRQLVSINEQIRNHSVEIIGEELRSYMTDMKKIV
jgi:ketol-acid reductoisomerase